MAEAINYTLSQWKAIEDIFTKGEYYLDNNLVERYNRYISLSRRNSLFFGSHKGAERGVILYSLACSCRMHGINTFEYIADVINKAAKLPPNTDRKIYRDLLPHKWKENRSRIWKEKDYLIFWRKTRHRRDAYDSREKIMRDTYLRSISHSVIY